MHNNGSFKVPGLFGWLVILFGDKLINLVESTCSGDLKARLTNTVTDENVLEELKPVVVKGVCKEIKDHVWKSDPSVCTWIQTQLWAQQQAPSL